MARNNSGCNRVSANAAGWPGGLVVRAILAALTLGLSLPACQRGTGSQENQEPPPELLERLTSTELHTALGMLDRELVSAMSGGLQGRGQASFERAEAISDRLLETRFPFARLRADDYSLRARIRQIQSLTDRIQALLLSGAPHDSALADLGRLRHNVLALRQELAQGGTAAPIPLDRLLAGRDTLDLLSGEGASGE